MSVFIDAYGNSVQTGSTVPVLLHYEEIKFFAFCDEWDKIK